MLKGVFVQAFINVPGINLFDPELGDLFRLRLIERKSAKYVEAVTKRGIVSRWSAYFRRPVDDAAFLPEAGRENPFTKILSVSVSDWGFVDGESANYFFECSAASTKLDIVALRRAFFASIALGPVSVVKGHGLFSLDDSLRDSEPVGAAAAFQVLVDSAGARTAGYEQSAYNDSVFAVPRASF